MTDLREAIVAVIRENLMSTDHPISEWEEQFADAVLAILPDAEAMAEALERRDAKASECPIDRPRCVSKPPETCPRCFAKRNDICFVKHDADYRFVSEVRDALANYRKGTGRAEA